MSWHEGERATVIAGVILAAVALVAYIGIVHAAWNFATLTTPDQPAAGPGFCQFLVGGEAGAVRKSSRGL